VGFPTQLSISFHCYFRRRAYGPAIAGNEHSDIDD